MNEQTFLARIDVWGMGQTFPFNSSWAVETNIQLLLDQILPVLGSWAQAVKDKWNLWKDRMKTWFLSEWTPATIADVEALQDLMTDAAQYAADEENVDLWGLDGLPSYPASGGDSTPGNP